MTTTTTKPNRYAAKCNTCGGNVPAGEGVLAGRMVGGNRRWLVRHADGTPGCERTPAMPVNRPVRRPADRPDGNLASSWNRRVYLSVDPKFVSWVAELILEHGSIAAARDEFAVANEHWDGEDEARRYAMARFDAALIPALEQNKALYGETRCAECDRPGPRVVDCVLCQHDSGLDG